MEGKVECPNGCGYVGDKDSLDTHLENECVVVKERREKRVREAKEEGMKEFSGRVNPNAEEMERLIVGGSKRFEIKRSHLEKYKNSHLGYIFSSKWKLRRDSEGYVILDREEKRFGHLLEWLRR